jgi:hypothetical protein
MISANMEVVKINENRDLIRICWDDALGCITTIIVPCVALLYFRNSIEHCEDVDVSGKVYSLKSFVNAD